MNATFKTKSGRLTEYAFRCGYLEEYNSGDLYIKLWKEGGFDIILFDNRNHYRAFWITFDSIVKARKSFDAMKRAMQLGNNNIIELAKMAGAIKMNPDSFFLTFFYFRGMQFKCTSPVTENRYEAIEKSIRDYCERNERDVNAEEVDSAIRSFRNATDAEKVSYMVDHEM